jgi:FkbM family methyltransferase
VAGLLSTARNRIGARVKRLGERTRLQIQTHRPRGPRRARLLAEHGIELVIDVGAHHGEYATELRAHGYAGRIVSLEPASAAFDILRQRAAGDPEWEVRRLAAWDAAGELELGLADNFSSPLAPEPRLADLFHEAVPKAVEAVPAARLDEARIELDRAGPTLLKLDVQGSERRALAGASGLLQNLELIELELSVAPLYRGQALLSDLVCLLADQGYGLLALDPIVRDRLTGEYLQFDGVFGRRVVVPAERHA